MMGEMADALIDGEQCSHCGVMFKEAHGHEILCHGCYDSETPAERAGIQRAYIEEAF